MEVLAHVLNVMFIFLIFTSLFNLLQKGSSGLIKNEKLSKDKSEHQQPVLKETEPIEMVKDNVCNTLLQKDKAYILRVNDQAHYFCSWKCRQKYINEKT